MIVADAKASHHESSEKIIGNTIAKTEKRKKCRTPEWDHHQYKTYLENGETVRTPFLHKSGYIYEVIYIRE